MSKRTFSILSVILASFLLTNCGGPGGGIGSGDGSTYIEVKFPNTDSTEIQGTLYRPKGEGPFPSVILLHTSGGLQEHVFNWATWLANEGYLALAVDSFGSRGRERSIRGGDSFNLAKDAYGARDYLKTLAYADKKGIGVMGFSMGGVAALEASSFAESGFGAAVALYPHCREWDAEESVPVLLLLAGEDDWGSRPVEACLDSAKIGRNNGRIIEWKVYSGVHHGFDNELHEGGRHSLDRGEGMPSGYLEYNHVATLDAWKRLLIFFNKHLRGGK